MLDDELRQAIQTTLPDDLPHVFISAVTGQGIDTLKDLLWASITDERNQIATNQPSPTDHSTHTTASPTKTSSSYSPTHRPPTPTTTPKNTSTKTTATKANGTPTGTTTTQPPDSTTTDTHHTTTMDTTTPHHTQRRTKRHRTLHTPRSHPSNRPLRRNQLLPLHRRHTPSHPNITHPPRPTPPHTPPKTHHTPADPLRQRRHNHPPPPHPTLTDTDALVTNLPRTPLLIHTADCVPIILHDPHTHTIAAIHAGWREPSPTSPPTPSTP